MGAAALTLLAGAASADTLRIGAQADAGTMDPQAQNIQTTITVLSWIYEPLVTRDENMAKAPMLATAWEQTDDTTWRFTLRDGVTFADGAPFTADDVKFTIERSQAPSSQFSGYTAGLTVNVVDDLSVDVVTPKPDPLLPDRLANIPIMDKEWTEANGALTPQDLKSGEESYTALHANGTGPYVLESRAPDSKSVFTLRDDYWGEMADDIETIEFNPIASDPTRIAALLSGELDLVIDVPSQAVARLEASPGIKIEQVDEFRTIFFGFDLANDDPQYVEAEGNPFKKKEVREAISYAVDRDAIVKTVMRGLASKTNQILAPKNNGYLAANDEAPAYDPEKAKELLAEAGYPDGFAFTLDCPNNRYINDEQVCRTLVTMLSRIGLDVTLNAMPRAQYFPKLWERDTSAFMMGFNSPFADGMYALETMLMSRNDDAGEGIYNYNQYANPELDAKIRSARDELDAAKRTALMEEIFTEITDEVLYVPLYNQVLVYAMKDTVTAPVRPDNWLEIRWVTMD